MTVVYDCKIFNTPTMPLINRRMIGFLTWNVGLRVMNWTFGEVMFQKDDNYWKTGLRTVFDHAGGKEKYKQEEQHKWFC